MWTSQRRPGRSSAFSTFPPSSSLPARRRCPTCRVEDGDGGLVPTHPGKEQTSWVACGRPAWRPHSEALNNHEIIIRGAAAVAAAATLFLQGQVREAGPDSAHT